MAMKLFHISPETNLDLLVDNLWDGQHEGYRQQVVISIRRGRIAAVQPREMQGTGNGTQQMRLTGLTVLPGLIDAHVHLALDGIDFQASLDRWQDPLLRERVLARALRVSLEHGLVAIRDGSDREGLNLQAREWVRAGKYPGPRVVATGMAVNKKGKYGSFLGPGTTDPASIRELVTDLVNRNVDQVKVVVSGLVTFHRYGEVGSLEFATAELVEAVKTAHAAGRPVMAHVNSAPGVDLALAAGVDSIEHGYFLTTAQLETMAARGTFWVPTVAAIANRLHTAKREVYPEREIDIIRRTQESQQEMVARAHRLGVKLVVGTDAGAPGVYHGESYLDELLYWYQAGIPAAAILRAATVTAAAALGLDGELGQIRPGYRPCLIAVRGNPLENLKVLAQPEMVFIDN
ncbi:imidazolonepropionase and related amidohydrolases [Moorella thermoacetica Y72]|uniref:Imidazolonepropionase and related amidohydrolases n=2 Tax=Neomoorella thermoacetica TaxID=1525 RepID=A0A0S6UAX8_NEOTH|nr:imidazolonepropionase and related amidohydrolases [Moorella thermoacetica Y72]